MSGWLEKLVTAVRGAVNEAGEAAADSQALRILEQEMRDAREELEKAKTSLTAVMAEEKLAGKQVATLQGKITEHEGYALQALEKNDETLASEIATKIAEFEGDLAAQKELHAGYANNVTQLKQTIRATETRLKTMEREVKNVKATEQAQKASLQAAAKYSGSDTSMRKATDSLQRLKERQRKRSAQMEAAQELANESSGDDLAQRMKAAGIIEGGSTAGSVLDRLKAKKAG